MEGAPTGAPSRVGAPGCAPASLHVAGCFCLRRSARIPLASLCRGRWRFRSLRRSVLTHGLDGAARGAWACLGRGRAQARPYDRSPKPSGCIGCRGSGYVDPVRWRPHRRGGHREVVTVLLRHRAHQILEPPLARRRGDDPDDDALEVRAYVAAGLLRGFAGPPSRSRSCGTCRRNGPARPCDRFPGPRLRRTARRPGGAPPGRPPARSAVSRRRSGRRRRPRRSGRCATWRRTRARCRASS